MKRFARDNQNIDSINMASVLMRLSQGHSVDESTAQSTARIYQCKTCSRQFPSFQALGGHRASHKKPRPVGDSGPGGLQARNRVHECPVCGLEFAIGQALGGHMRRHRAAEVGGAGGGSGRAKRGWLDLNLPAAEEEEEMEWKKMVDKISMVDCFH